MSCGSALYFVGRHGREGVAVFLAGANANHVIERLNEDLAVADVAGARRLENRLDRGLHERFGHGDLDPHLLAELEHDGRAAVVLDDLLFAAVPARAGQRHAGHARLGTALPSRR